MPNRVAAKRLAGQQRVQTLLLVLVMFCQQPEGFRNRQLRPGLSQLCDLKPPGAAPLKHAFTRFQHALDAYADEQIAA